MSCEYCKVCEELKFSWRKHKCPPVFYAKHEIFGDEPKEFYADSFEEAALKFAKYYNEDGDYALMNSCEQVIISDGIKEKKFSISSEPDIYYSITKID